jgi:hypothetical protein
LSCWTIPSWKWVCLRVFWRIHRSFFNYVYYQNRSFLRDPSFYRIGTQQFQPFYSSSNKTVKFQEVPEHSPYWPWILFPLADRYSFEIWLQTNRKHSIFSKFAATKIKWWFTDVIGNLVFRDYCNFFISYSLLFVLMLTPYKILRNPSKLML